MLSFEELLELHKLFSIHHTNIQALAIELFKNLLVYFNPPQRSFCEETRLLVFTKGVFRGRLCGAKF